MTTGTRAAIPPASPRRTRRSPRGSIRCSPAGKLANYLSVLTLEAQTIARACGKSHVHNLEPEDLVALTVEAAAMARVPLAGTNWIPGAKACDEFSIVIPDARSDDPESRPRPALSWIPDTRFAGRDDAELRGLIR